MTIHTVNSRYSYLSKRCTLHMDLETDNVEAEVKRLEALGAVRWDHQQERGFEFWVLQDPWDNEFCVLQEEFPELLARRRLWSAQPLMD